jgi:DNA-binding GntR family transcriptional regulator
MEFDTNEIILNKHRKEVIANSLGVSYYTIRNSINELVDREILQKTDRTTYYVNSKLFHKGNTTGDQKVEYVKD